MLLDLLLSLKTSRPDGTLIPGLHKYRQMMYYIMPGRNESVVYYDTRVRVERLLAYLEKVNQRFHCDITHAVVAAGSIGLLEAPRMNRFVAGRRLYQRKRREITFSVKRKKKDESAALGAIKVVCEDGETFKAFCDRVASRIDLLRSGRKTGHDKEYDLLTAIPRPLLEAGCRLVRWADFNNILPAAFIDPDPMYTSMFIANLGSVQMEAGFHHLYEWGNCPLFLMLGQIEERPVVVDGKITVQRVLPLRWSYDERVDDGLSTRRGIMACNTALEDPFHYLGCTEPDGSDDFALGSRRVPEELLAVK